MSETISLIVETSREHPTTEMDSRPDEPDQTQEDRAG
jgi:hypothetical protein